MAVSRLGMGGLFRSQIPRMAAAMSYRTIFSIIPIMALGLLIFGSFVSDEDVDIGVRRVLGFIGVSQISEVQSEMERQRAARVTPYESGLLVGPPANQPQTDGAQGSARGATSADRTEQSGAGDLEQVITDLIARVNSSIRNVPTGWIAIASVVVLIYAAMSMLIEIEKAFNQLTSAPSGRPWLRRLMLYWTMLTLGTLLLAATFLVGDVLASWIRSISGETNIIGATLAGFGVSVLISTVLLLAMYLTIPNTRIKVRAALAGAFIAAILWEVGKSAFTLYLKEATGYTKFYGSLAILPIFLMWVYLTWVIVLLGMQATFALQHFARLVESGLAARAGAGKPGTALLDPLVMVGAGVVIAKAFNEGKNVTADSLALALDVDSALADRLLVTLQTRGVLHLIAQGEDADDAYTLSRPGDKVRVGELLDAGYEIDVLRRSDSDLLPDDLLGAARDRAADRTLADLVREGSSGSAQGAVSGTGSGTGSGDPVPAS